MKIKFPFHCPNNIVYRGAKRFKRHQSMPLNGQVELWAALRELDRAKLLGVKFG